jgi:hypothetical protein
MRMPRVRFTVRRLMIAVAVAALLLGGDVLWRKRAGYLARANVEAASEMQSRALIKVYESAIETSAAPSVADGYRHWVEVHREEADYHGRLRRKYERAARYPWLPVEPDPRWPGPGS